MNRIFMAVARETRIYARGSARLARESGDSKILIDSGDERHSRVGIIVSVNRMLEYWTKIP